MSKGKKSQPLKEKPALPALFIASSAESLEVTHQLQAAAKHYFTAKPWTAGVVRPSKSPVQSLEKELGKAQYAVFVFGKDDEVVSRHKKFESVRDNVLLELGMFIGRLGSEKCFVVLPKNKAKLKIPSDLEGFIPIAYDDVAFVDNPELVAVAVVTEIRNAIRDFAPVPASIPKEATAVAPLLVEPVNLAGAISDVLETLARERTGPAHILSKPSLQVWAQTVLKNCLHVLRTTDASIPPDAYVAWSRPTGTSTKRKLKVFLADNLPKDYQHYAFAPNEGLAGTVWASGQAAIHTQASPHPTWKVRQGCENASYVAVPVGTASKSGGILSMGSDIGYAAKPVHESVLKAFASVLAVAIV